MSQKLSAKNVTPKGLRARDYSKFRSPRYNEVVVATENEGVAFHPASVAATASGNTVVIAAPGAGLCIRIKTLMVNNVGADQRVVYLREGTAGSAKYKNSMPQYGSMWNLNLIGSYWILPPNTALYVNLDNTGSVNVQAGYDLVKAIPDPALTDAMTISESLVSVHTEG